MLKISLLIQAENIGKRYIIKSRSIKTIVNDKLNFRHDTTHDFWALRHATLEVNSGDFIALTGPNGSGKSTLLKILSRITSPTEGELKIYGSVVSLLEASAGLHPELSARENIFLNAACFGIKRAETQRCLPEIIKFAGIQEFIDTPVKRFSSGMFARLAFSIAIITRPDIFILDEVLSVADKNFIGEASAKLLDLTKNGSAVILCSHNFNSFPKSFTRVIRCDAGELSFPSPDTLA